MSEVRGLSIRQPYAWAIAAGRKDVENRRQYTAFRGLLLIHAAGAWHPAGETDPVMAAAWGEEVERLGIGPAGYSGPVHPMRHPDLFPTGGIIALARLTEAHPAQPGCCPPWGLAGPQAAHHWRIGEVRRLRRPVPAKGRLGLWRPTADLMAAVRAQLPVNGAAR